MLNNDRRFWKGPVSSSGGGGGGCQTNRVNVSIVWGHVPALYLTESFYIRHIYRQEITTNSWLVKGVLISM